MTFLSVCIIIYDYVLKYLNIQIPTSLTSGHGKRKQAPEITWKQDPTGEIEGKPYTARISVSSRPGISKYQSTGKRVTKRECASPSGYRERAER